MKMRKQRLMGVGLLAISWLVLLLACTGESPEDQDATAALLVLPPGPVYGLFGRLPPLRRGARVPGPGQAGGGTLEPTI